jgi:hypothetical protein
MGEMRDDVRGIVSELARYRIRGGGPPPSRDIAEVLRGIDEMVGEHNRRSLTRASWALPEVVAAFRRGLDDQVARAGRTEPPAGRTEPPAGSGAGDGEWA